MRCVMVLLLCQLEERNVDETGIFAKPTEEEAKKTKAKELDWKRFGILLDMCYEFYISDTSKPDLAVFCQLMVRISQDFQGEILTFIPERWRNRLIGEMVVKAVRYDHGRVFGTKPMTNKAVFQSLVVKLVDLAYRDGHPKNKTSQKAGTTAFQFTADLIYRYGITNNGRKYSASTISNWCN